MREIGGYIELDTYHWTMFHEKALALNCGRNCLTYLIRARKIERIALPYFLCDSVRNVCRRENVEVRFYHIGMDFLPLDFTLQDKEWLYLVNYYGQLDNGVIRTIADQYKRVIVDNAQAYFQTAIENLDTVYTCRKFFGVADGAFLYTDAVLEEGLIRDESWDRMGSLLGRFERSASEFYDEHSGRERAFESEPIKRMSRLTENLLCAVDYKAVKQKRNRNFMDLYQELAGVNKLDLKVPDGAFMYPLYVEEGAKIRKKLIEEKIYIPILWREVSDRHGSTDLERDMAMNILPLPVDQRYGSEEMRIMIDKIHGILFENSTP